VNGAERLVLGDKDAAALQSCELFKKHIGGNQVENEYHLSMLNIPGLNKPTFKKYIDFLRGNSSGLVLPSDALATVRFADCFGAPTTPSLLNCAAQSVLYCASQIRNQRCGSYRAFLEDQQGLALDMVREGIVTINWGENQRNIPYLIYLLMQSSHMKIDMLSKRLCAFDIDESVLGKLSHFDIDMKQIVCNACTIQGCILNDICPSIYWLKTKFPYLKSFRFDGAHLCHVQNLMSAWAGDIKSISMKEKKIQANGFAITLKKNQFKKYMSAQKKQQAAFSTHRTHFHISPHVACKTFMGVLMASCFLFLITGLYEQLTTQPPLVDYIAHSVQCNNIGHIQCTQFACKWIFAQICDKVGAVVCPEFICECVPYQLLQGDHAFMCPNQ
jgi:hypothetical protein